MKKNARRPHVVMISLVCFCGLILCRIGFVQAFNIGTTYDSNNWQGIEDIALPVLKNWVKSGEFIVKTGAIHFDFDLEKDFLEASQENLVKFDINEAGFIVNKQSRKQAEFIYGLPFPRINAQGSNAGKMVMANFHYGLWRMGGFIGPGRSFNLGKGGVEVERVTVIRHLYYQGRLGGPIQNRDNLLFQGVMNVVEPMSLKDLVPPMVIITKIRQDRKMLFELEWCC